MIVQRRHQRQQAIDKAVQGTGGIILQPLQVQLVANYRSVAVRIRTAVHASFQHTHNSTFAMLKT